VKKKEKQVRLLESLKALGTTWRFS